MGLDPETGFELIKQSYKQKAEKYKQKADEMLWQRWLVDYARMDKDSFVGFQEYKKKLMVTSTSTHKSKSAKTKEEIIKDSEKIIAAWKGGNT